MNKKIFMTSLKDATFFKTSFISILGCGHCKSLAPVYEKVAETFKNEPNVSFVHFDVMN